MSFKWGADSIVSKSFPPFQSHLTYLQSLSKIIVVIEKTFQRADYQKVVFFGNPLFA